MEQSRKKLLINILAIMVIIGTIFGVSIAFFNYTRTGPANTISVGRIYFSMNQSNTINLTNLFPIDPTETGIMNDTTKVGTLTVEIEGDTDYADGIEYLVSSVDSNIYTSTGKTVPISLDVTVTDLGTPNTNYFTARENTNESIYKKIVGDTLVGDQMLLVGFIKPNTTSGSASGVDGSITIKAYLDKNKILISDTYDGTESDNMGTPNSMAQGKTVFTTTEWNSLQSSGVSFKVKVEANQGIWVNGSLEEIMRKSAVMDNINSTYVSASTGIDFGKKSGDTDNDGVIDNGKGIYMRAGTENDVYPIMYYRGAVEDNNVKFANKCWKAVRTTDTGGVKLIYNGEETFDYSYNFSDRYSREAYLNVLQPEEGTNTYGIFNGFNQTSNTYDVTIDTNNGAALYFTVPTGDNYALEVEGTTGQTTGGSVLIYKNTQIVSSTGGGGGQAINYTYTYGTLSSSDVLGVEFSGSGSNESPITLKIKMKRNDVDLQENEYTITTNGKRIVIDNFEFSDDSQEWILQSSNEKIQASISFNVKDPGEYAVRVDFGVNGNNGCPTSNNISIRKDSTSYTRYCDGVTDIGSLAVSNNITLSYNSTPINPIKISLIKKEGSCNNTGSATQITLNNSNEFAFSETNLNKSPAYNGYMWGTVYEYSNNNWTSGAKFGSSFIWDGTNYTLVDVDTTSSVPSVTRHYSCNSSSATATCTDLRYVYVYNYWSGSTTLNNNTYYITLQNGKGINDALAEMQTNTVDSNAKEKIEDWYEANMTSYTSKIEDTIYCNDRSMNTLGESTYTDNGWKADGNLKNNYLYYAPYGRLRTGAPSLTCSKNDRFTWKNSAGNQKLQYPVAMLSSDEIMLAGGSFSSNETYYLRTNGYFWTMSPGFVDYGNACEFVVYGGGYLSSSGVYNSRGLRPVVSLKPGTPVVRGSGTVYDPYIIS